MIPPDSRLRRAIHLRSPSLVEHVICTNPSLPTLIRNHDPSDKGNTSLHLAAKLGLVEIAEVLLVYGHEDNGFTRNADGACPLMLACRAGSDEEDETVAGMIKVGKLLVEKYPEMIRIQDHDGWNAFHHAARYGTNALLHHFLTLPRDLIEPSLPFNVEDDDAKAEPDTNSRPSSPTTPPSPTSQQPAPPQAQPTSQLRRQAFPPRKDSLQGATQYRPSTPKPSRPVSSSTITLSAHPLLKSTTADGNTALHLTSAFGHLKTLRLLVSAGADAGARNAANWSPIDYSASVQAEVYLRTLIREKETRELRGSVPIDSEDKLLGGDSLPRPSLPSILPSQMKTQQQQQSRQPPPPPPVPKSTTPVPAAARSEGFVGPTRSRGFVGPGQTKSYMGAFSPSHSQSQAQSQTQAQSQVKAQAQSQAQASPTRNTESRPLFQRSPARSTFQLPSSSQTSSTSQASNVPFPTAASQASSVGFTSLASTGQRRAEPGRFNAKPGVRLVQSEGSGDESEGSSDGGVAANRSRAAT